MNAVVESLNHWGSTWPDIARAMFWQSSVLVLVLLAMDFGLRHRVRAAVRHGLWLALLVKLILPPALALPTSPAWWWSRATAAPLPMNVVPSRDYTITQDDLPMMDMSAPLPLASLPPPPSLSLPAWGLLMASAVSLGLLAWLLGRWRQVMRTSRAARPDAELSLRLTEARQLANLQSAVPVKLTRDTMSPAVCGLFRPVILLPQSLAETLTPGQLRAVLLHELMHVRRGDVWVNFAQALLQIVYWWHPMVWLANARLRRVREEAVDEAVMVALRTESEIYAPTLLAVAKFALQRPLASLGLVGILESRSALRQRIERLVNLPVPQRAGLGLVSALAIVAFSAVALPMGDAPPLPPPTISTSASSPKTPWPDPRFEGYRNVNLLAHFLIVDQAQLRHGVPALANPQSPCLIPPPEVDGLLTQLKTAGARFYNDYPGGIAQPGISGDNFRYFIGGVTNAMGDVEWETTNVAGRNITCGWKARMPATQPDWTPMDLTLHPWLADGATRCQFELSVGGKRLTSQPGEMVIPSEGALTWVVPTPAQPGKCQVILVMSWDSTNHHGSPPFLNRTFSLPPAALSAAWHARGWPTNGNDDSWSMIDDFIHAAGLNWLPPRRFTYTNDELAVYAPASDQAIIASVLLGIRPTMTPNSSTNARLPASTLVQDGKLLYEMGKLDEAGVKLKDAIKLDPENAAAFYYLNLIQQAQFARTNQTLQYTGPGRQEIIRKLDSIRLASVAYAKWPLNEVLRDLSPQAKQLDPEHTGINFLINSISTPPINPTTGLPVTNPPDSFDVGAVRIQLNLTNVLLADVLDAIVLVADHPIKYSIQDFAVVFSAKAPETAPLFMRTFKVSADIFDSILPSTSLTGTNATGSARAPELAVRLHNYFNTRGVDLKAPKALFYNERLGLLFVKATEADLDEIERTIERLNQLSPQSQLKLRYLQLPQNDSNTLGFQWYLGQFGGSASVPVSPANSVGAFSGIAATNHFSLSGFQKTGPTISPITGILSNPSFQTAIHALEQRQGVETLVEPYVTTTSGRQTRMMSSANDLNRIEMPLQFNVPTVTPSTNRGVTASPATNALFMRTFKVRAAIFSSVRPPSSLTGTNATGPARATDLAVRLRNFFSTLGVNLKAPKAIFYNDRLGLLFLKATESDLNTIERAIKVLNETAPQLHIKARFIEIAGDAVSFPTLTNHQTVPNLVGILTPAATAKFLQEHRYRAGFTELAEPEVTTTTGRQTQMRSTEVRTIITGISPKALTPPGLTRAEMTNNPTGLFVVTNREFGPVFDVVPYVLSDGYTINLTIIANDDEFAGYDQPSNKLRIYVDDLPKNGDPATTVSPRPRINERQFVATANLYDNQTLILSQPVDPRTGLPAEQTGKKAKHLFVLATVTIVDPAGNRVHGDQEMSFAHDQVPPQPESHGPQLDDRPFDTPNFNSPFGGGGRERF